MKRAALGNLQAENYERHVLHRTDRAWTETNCYADLWIEVLHSLKLDPVACFPFTLAIDFEGDQWTFFKPPHAELHRLYGIDVQELNIWRNLEAHALEQVQRGRLVLAEVDAFYLPDTAGTDYQTQHTKTTIGIETIDPEAQRLGYFHNAGYFELKDANYASVLQPAGPLPTYVEFAKLTELKRMVPAELARTSLELLAGHLRRAPKANPITAFSGRYLLDVERLQQGQLPNYHLYVFATLRQLGASFDLAAHYLRWLGDRGEIGLEPGVEAFEGISTLAKSLILKTARAVTTRKPFEVRPLMAALESHWDAGMRLLRARFSA